MFQDDSTANSDVAASGFLCYLIIQKEILPIFLCFVGELDIQSLILWSSLKELPESTTKSFATANRLIHTFPYRQFPLRIETKSISSKAGPVFLLLPNFATKNGQNLTGFRECTENRIKVTRINLYIHLTILWKKRLIHEH